MRTRAGSAPDEVQAGFAPRRRSRAETRKALQLAIPRDKSKGLKLSSSAVATEAVRGWVYSLRPGGVRDIGFESANGVTLTWRRCRYRDCDPIHALSPMGPVSRESCRDIPSGFRLRVENHPGKRATTQSRQPHAP